MPTVDPWHSSSTSNLTTIPSQPPPPAKRADPWAPMMGAQSISPLGIRSTNHLSNQDLSSPMLGGLSNNLISTNSTAPTHLISPSSDLDEFDLISNRNVNGTTNNNKVNRIYRQL